MVAAVLCCIALNVVAATPASELASAHRKLDMIETDRAPAGSTVRLTAGELTEYAREQAEIIAPGAVRNAVFTIMPGGAQAAADMNFVSIPKLAGGSPSWILRQLLGGIHPVNIEVRIESARGRARVNVQRVVIDSIPVNPDTVSFFMRHFVMPSFPEAVIGEWFDLGHRIEQIVPAQGYADVMIRRER